MTAIIKNYTEAVGRRKSAVARVRIMESAKQGFVVNNRPVEQYFGTHTEREQSILPLVTSGTAQKFYISAQVRGGGTVAQSHAIALGLARALVIVDAPRRAPLKKAGLLARSARIKERRKFGLKKARKAPKWSKR